MKPINYEDPALAYERFRDIQREVSSDANFPICFRLSSLIQIFSRFGGVISFLPYLWKSVELSVGYECKVPSKIPKSYGFPTISHEFHD